MTTSDWIQVATALIAVGASVTALVIATQDRKVQLRIARASRDQARLALELDYAVRLSTNRNLGGSTDPAESKRLGAEAMAIIGVLGPKWVPRQYEMVMGGMTPEELAMSMYVDDVASWLQWRTEATLAVQAIIDRIGEAADQDPR